MGSGDARTRRGKLFRGSHGNTRPKGNRKTKALQLRSTRTTGRKSRTG